MLKFDVNSILEDDFNNLLHPTYTNLAEKIKTTKEEGEKWVATTLSSLSHRCRAVSLSFLSFRSVTMVVVVDGGGGGCEI